MRLRTLIYISDMLEANVKGKRRTYKAACAICEQAERDLADGEIEIDAVDEKKKSRLEALNAFEEAQRCQRDFELQDWR